MGFTERLRERSRTAPVPSVATGGNGSNARDLNLFANTPLYLIMFAYGFGSRTASRFMNSTCFRKFLVGGRWEVVEYQLL